MARWGAAAGRHITSQMLSIGKAHSLRQGDLAGAFGVGLHFIVDLEAGKPMAQIAKAVQVLAGLSVTMTLTPPPEGKGRRGEGG